RIARTDFDRLLCLIGLAVDASAGHMDAVAVLLIPLVDEPVGVDLRGRPGGAVEILDFNGRRAGRGQAYGGRRRSSANECGRAQETAPRQTVFGRGHCCFLLEFVANCFAAIMSDDRNRLESHSASRSLRAFQAPKSTENGSSYRRIS